MLKLTSALRNGLMAFSSAALLSLAIVPFPALAEGKSKTAQWHPGHYILIGPASDSKVSDWLSYSPRFRGVQIVYRWNELEPSLGNYNFSAIKRHMALAKAANKHIWAQIQFKGFSADPFEVCPRDLKGSPKPGGGNYSAFYAYVRNGRIIRQPASWDPAVNHRLKNLLTAMGYALRSDSNASALEGVNMPESASGARPDDIAAQPNVLPLDKDQANNFVIQRFQTLNAALPHTQVMQYTNAIHPTAALPNNAAMVAKEIAEGVGFGGPDLDPRRSNLVENVYSQCALAAGKIPIGFAVQYADTMSPGGAADDVNDVRNTLDLAKGRKLNYVFWTNLDRYIPLVKQVLDQPALRTDPAGGLVKTYPSAIRPLLDR
ncbi:MAG: hypothetical protein U0103_25220 [Candidatus Obscuribacterales bacterium]|nr:MAG: hypothetical protein EKK48_29050 [Candidatus Melainabacteria bacterium]